MVVSKTWVSRQTLHAWLARVSGRGPGGAGGSVASARRVGRIRCRQQSRLCCWTCGWSSNWPNAGRAGAVTVGGFPFADYAEQLNLAGARGCPDDELRLINDVLRFVVDFGSCCQEIDRGRADLRARLTYRRQWDHRRASEINVVVAD